MFVLDESLAYLEFNFLKDYEVNSFGFCGSASVFLSTLIEN